MPSDRSWEIAPLFQSRAASASLPVRFGAIEEINDPRCVRLDRRQSDNHHEIRKSNTTAFVALKLHCALLEIESEIDEMHFGPETRSIGRYIVDIDGCLRATDKPFLSSRDILALQREGDTEASIIWEVNGESILLGSADRVEMDEDRVAFFRTREVERLFLKPFTDASLRPGGWSGKGPRALAA